MGEHPQRQDITSAQRCRKRGRPRRCTLGETATLLEHVPQRLNKTILGEPPRKTPLGEHPLRTTAGGHLRKDTCSTWPAHFCRSVGAGPLSETLAKAAARQTPRRPDNTTSPFRRLADMLLQPQPHFMAPLVVLSQLAAVDRGAFVRHSLELADAAFRGSRMLASSFLSWLLAPTPLGSFDFGVHGHRLRLRRHTNETVLCRRCRDVAPITTEPRRQAGGRPKKRSCA